MTDDIDDDIGRYLNVLAQLDAAAALRDALAMFADDDIDSADLVIMHNIDYARTALDTVRSYFTDRREQKDRSLDAEATDDAR